jgi:hypothetical protein
MWPSGARRWWTTSSCIPGMADVEAEGDGDVTVPINRAGGTMTPGAAAASCPPMTLTPSSEARATGTAASATHRSVLGRRWESVERAEAISRRPQASSMVVVRMPTGSAVSQPASR